MAAKWSGLLAAGAFAGFALGALVPAGSAQATPLIQNGDFSQTSLSSPGGSVCGGGSTCGQALTGWTVTCSTTGCGYGSTPTSLLAPGTNGSAWNSFGSSSIGLYSMASLPAGVTGNIFADDGDPAYRSTLSQTVNGLVVGDTYALTFYQAAAQQNGLSGATTEQWQVSFEGATQNSALIHNASQSSTPFTQQVLSFVATSTSSVLSFLSVGTPAGEPPISLLAGVSMADTTPVPEPGTIALLAAGLIGLTAVVRRRTA